MEPLQQPVPGNPVCGTLKGHQSTTFQEGTRHQAGGHYICRSLQGRQK